MKLSILIISYNTRQHTLACLESVYAQTRGIEFEVIVVDNASRDGSALAIAEQFPQVKLLTPGENLGFARANNLAARHAAGEYVLLLNPDIIILDGAIQKLAKFHDEHPQVGIGGGRTFFADGSLNASSCHGRSTPWSLLCMGFGLSSVFRNWRIFDPESLGGWQRDSVRRVDIVSGCFLMLSRALWKELEGFDESFFMYGEDADLCLRAARLSRPCMICPDATLIHYGGASEAVRADKMVRLFRAKALLFEKHWSPSTVGFGMSMLSLWAWTRMKALGVLSMIRPGRFQAGHETWKQIWRHRAQYSTRSSRMTGKPLASGV